MCRVNRPKLISTLLLGYTLLLAGNCHAQWVEATGSAEVRHGNKAEAKTKAVQNALKDALLFTGASVTSVARVTDGLLTQDQFKVSSQGSIRQLELVDETYQKGLAIITIRVDIDQNEGKQCFSADFQKSVAITQMHLANREQAKVGRLYDIGKTFSEHLYSQMRRESGTVVPRPWYQQRIDNQTNFEQYYDGDIKVIDAIGQSSDSQFVLLGQVSDLSFGEKTSSDLMFWRKEASERFFAVDVMLINSSTNELVYREQFDTSADWTMGKRRMVDINSRKFWESDYGKAIDRLVDHVKSAIEEVIYCQPLQGKIVKVDDNRVQFSLGSDNGVKKGQVFSIIQQSHFVNKNGKLLPRFVISPYQVKVTDVYTTTAIAESVGDELLGNIQTTDQVILKEMPEPSLDDMD